MSQTRRSQLWMFCWAIGVLSGIRASSAEPIDSLAAEHAPRLERLAKTPFAERELSEGDRDLFISLAQTDNADRKLVGVLGLAYGRDTVSLTLLKGLACGDDEFFAGAASYALVSRDVWGKGRDEQMRLLRLGLKQAANPYARLFLANRLAVDFRDDGLPAIIEAMKVEQNATVKCDMLYYLATASALPNAREVLDLKWDEAARLSESLAYIMGSLTPGRSKDAEKNSAMTLLSELRTKEAKSRRHDAQAP